MGDGDSTCWTLVHGAASGHRADRSEFARRYESVVRACLASRWRDSPLRREIDDATQEVFLECFKEGGALERAEPRRPGGFKAFLYGVVRNVAARFEAKLGRQAAREALPGLDPDTMQADEDGLSTAFDRAWARSIMRDAAQAQHARALKAGEAAVRRTDLLRLRFQEGKPIREIARLWGVDAAHLHREYPKAREEFRDALLDVMAFHHPGTRAEIEHECARLLASLA